MRFRLTVIIHYRKLRYEFMPAGGYLVAYYYSALALEPVTFEIACSVLALHSLAAG